MSGRDEWRARFAEKAEHERQQVREMAASFGARVVRFGEGWRIVGPTCDLFVIDLRYVRREDFFGGNQ